MTHPKTTYRFFVNNKRVATAVTWERVPGQPCILEVSAPSIPNLSLQIFDSINQWKEHCERYYVPKTSIRIETSSNTTEFIPRKQWICPACKKGPGNDHRMCICTAYNYSVAAWEEACGIRK
jgi:hypothetical protein